MAESLGMDIFPQFEAFKAHIDRHQAATGETHAQIAKHLGVDTQTLRNWCYGWKKPGIKRLQAAAELFGCSVTEFVDDPGKKIGANQANNLTEARRFVANAMFNGITADELSDEDAQILYEEYLAAKQRLLSMKARLLAK